MKKNKQNEKIQKSENLISQSEAAKRAGVSRQAINSLKDTYNFFEGSKVNTDHPHWKGYLQEKKRPAEKKPVSKSKSKKEQSGSKKKTVQSKSNIPDEKLLQNESNKQKHTLTGGYDPANMIPSSPQQLKALTDIQEKNINMRVKLSELIDIEMVLSIMEVVARDIGGIRNIGRKVSGLICMKLDCVGMEKAVEKIIDGETENIIKMVKKNMSKNIDIESYK